MKIVHLTKGCSMASRGCKNCISGAPFEDFAIGDISELYTKNPSFVLVNTGSDLFFEKVPDEFILSVLSSMRKNKKNIYMTMTKRMDRVIGFAGELKKVPNLILGTSIEDSSCLDRLGKLKQIEGVYKYVDFKPLLEEFDPGDMSGIHFVQIGPEHGEGAREYSTDFSRAILFRSISAGCEVSFSTFGAGFFSLPSIVYKFLEEGKTMNETMLFQTISQLAIQYVMRDQISEAEAIAKAKSFVTNMVKAAKEISQS